MKTNSLQRAQKAAEALSKVRKYKVNFTRQELIDALKKERFPYSNEGVHLLKSLNIIAKDNDGYYFISKDPVHYSKLRIPLETLCQKYRKPCNTENSNKITFKKSAYIVEHNEKSHLILSEEVLLEFIKTHDRVLITKKEIYG